MNKKISKLLLIGFFAFLNPVSLQSQPSVVEFVVLASAEKICDDLASLTPPQRLAVLTVWMAAGSYVVFRVTDYSCKGVYRVVKDLGSTCKNGVSVLHEDAVNIASSCSNAAAKLYDDATTPFKIVKKHLSQKNV